MEQDKKTKAKSVKSKAKTVKPKTKTATPKKIHAKSIVDSNPTLVKNPVTKPGNVGQTLKDTRLKQGMSLNDVMKHLYIQREYLEAIENSTYDKLPEMAYTIGFVRAYSQLLKMDPEHLIKEFQKEYTPPKDSNEGILLGTQPINQKPSKNILWMAAGGLLVVFVLIYLFSSKNPKSDTLLAQPVALNIIPEVPIETPSSAQ